jgi:hypothetical protein
MGESTLIATDNVTTGKFSANVRVGHYSLKGIVSVLSTIQPKLDAGFER